MTDPAQCRWVTSVPTYVLPLARPEVEYEADWDCGNDAWLHTCGPDCTPDSGDGAAS